MRTVYLTRDLDRDGASRRLGRDRVAHLDPLCHAIRTGRSGHDRIYKWPGRVLDRRVRMSVPERVGPHGQPGGRQATSVDWPICPACLEASPEPDWSEGLCRSEHRPRVDRIFQAALDAPDTTPSLRRRVEAALHAEELMPLFFPSGRDGGHDARVPKLICAECPIAAGCRDYAATRRLPAGIWGGTTPTTRAREVA